MKQVILIIATAISFLGITGCGKESQQSTLADGSEKSDPALGDPITMLAVGEYASSYEKTPLLRNVKMKGWEDEIYIEAQISYTYRGGMRWVGISGQVLKDVAPDNSFSLKTTYPMANGSAICSVPVTLVFRAYEQGFQMKSYQPHLIDNDYCLYYQYRWVPSPKPFIRKN